MKVKRSLEKKTRFIIIIIIIVIIIIIILAGGDGEGCISCKRSFLNFYIFSSPKLKGKLII